MEKRIIQVNYGGNIDFQIVMQLPQNWQEMDEAQKQGQIEQCILMNLSYELAEEGQE